MRVMPLGPGRKHRQFTELDYMNPIAAAETPINQFCIKKMAAAAGAFLNHVSRESSDVRRLADFYKEFFGFEEVENPKFEFGVIWLKLGSSLFLHLIERDPKTKLPEGPWSATSAVADPKNLPRGHHVCFSVSNFDSFVQTLKEKGIETHERTQPNGKTKQVFFFDPDGNGLEVAST